MANINKIRLSGTTYNIEDENASKTVELTQAQYDALATKEPNTYYVITDATAVDMANYYDKTETDDLLDAKQDALVSGTNIKTINNESILGEGNIDIQGGSSITVDDALSTTSENPVQNKVITNALNSKGESLMWDMTASAKKYAQLRLQTGNKTISSANLQLGDYLQYGYPTSSALNITGLTPTTDFETHTGDTTIHVTSTEKAAWNGAVTDVNGIKPYIWDITQAFTDELWTALMDVYENKKPLYILWNIELFYCESIAFLDSATTTYSTDTLYFAFSDGTMHADFQLYKVASNDYQFNLDRYSLVVDSSLSTSSTNSVQNAVVTTALNGKQNTISDLSTIRTNATNGNTALTNLGGLKLVSLTQAQYDALSTKDASTIYFING